ncbi:MAG: hypothetical protein M5R42_11275 [Rhodocyclaceae bacterium]|nr:hypothetical protein [Rhodocyclaceae bacterium]
MGRKVGDTDLASYLMYPKVFKDYAAHRSHYGDVSQLPTPAFFSTAWPSARRSPSRSTAARP